MTDKPTLHSKLMTMSRAERGRYLCYDANSGCPVGQREAVLGALAPDGRATIAARELRIQGPSDKTHLVDTLPVAPPACDGVPAVIVGDASAVELLSGLVDGDRVRFPILPWFAGSADGEGVVPLPGHLSVDSSFRTAAYHAEGSEAHVLIKVAYPLLKSERFSAARLRMQLKARILQATFGIDPVAWTGGDPAMDAIQAVRMSGTFARATERLGGRWALQRERVAILDGAGGAYVIRDPEPYPARGDGALLLPLISLVGSPNTRTAHLLAALSLSTGRTAEDLAFEVGRALVSTWHELWTLHGILALCPHAQNVAIELLPDDSFGRIVYKDMRDVEEWGAYRDVTSHSERLQAISKNYLRYQMTAHPVYFDAQRFSGPRRQLAADVFSYSFFMLRNYVLRSLGSAAEAASPGSAQRLAVRFALLVTALSQGDGSAAVSSARSAHLCFAEAARRLRANWVNGAAG